MVDVETRFWNKVSVCDPDACWEWKAQKYKNGYGIFKVNNKRRMSHRFCWELHFGTIPQGLCVLHKCDNPSCVNPNHLFLGTQLDNIADMNNKGRHGDTRGEKSGMSKLTKEDVDCIRFVYSNGDATQRSLARDFGVSHHAVYLIVNNKRWKEAMYD